MLSQSAGLKCLEMSEKFNNTKKLSMQQKSINKLSPQEKFNKNWRNSDGSISFFIFLCNDIFNEK